MNVADLALGHEDAMGETVLLFYGLKPPEYAVYRTPRRVAIQYADASQDASTKRHKLAPLNPLRGEINGLIDGWRNNRHQALRDKSERFDQRVADALICALEDDLDGATALLIQIKQDLIDLRTSWGRFVYLMTACGLSLMFVALVVLITHFLIRRCDTDVLNLYRGAAAGTIGAFFSIAIGIRKRTVLPDLQQTSNLIDSALRIIIGLIGGIVLVLLLDCGFITFKLGSSQVGAIDAHDYLKILVVGFVAGFSERFVPDLLEKANIGGKAADDTARNVAPNAAKKPQAATGSDTGTQAAADPEASSASDPDGDLDHCVCDHAIGPLDATPDDALPAAAGGVARL